MVEKSSPNPGSRRRRGRPLAEKCSRGHPYDEENTRINPDGTRACRACARENAQTYRDGGKKPRPKYASIRERLEAQRIVTEEGCWVLPLRPNAHGYQQLSVQVDGKKTTRAAHLVAYELWKGPIPEGLHLDHLCHNRDELCPGGSGCRHRRCWNPGHLEAVEIGENLRRGKGFVGQNVRKTHCPEGHPYDEKNTYITPNKGGRMCRECNRLRSANS